MKYRQKYWETSKKLKECMSCHQDENHVVEMFRVSPDKLAKLYMCGMCLDKEEKINHDPRYDR